MQNKIVNCNGIEIANNKKITFGEMPPLKKYKMDHRFQAFKKIRKFL